MGARLSSTNQLDDGIAVEAASHPEASFPATINTKDLLNRLHGDLADFVTEVQNLKEGEGRQKVSVPRQYIDMRLCEIATCLVRYNDTRTDLFRNKSLGLKQSSKSSQDGIPDQLNIEGLQEKIKTLEDDIKKYETENYKQRDIIKELEKRLSEIAGAKPVDNNPVIADLSDINRPTKLAELYGELYDNEYTDATENLEKTGLADDEIIKTLRLTLLSTFSFCQKKAGQLVRTIERAVTELSDEYQLAMLSQNHGGAMVNELYIMNKWRNDPNQESNPGDSRPDLGTTVIEGTVDIEDILIWFRKEVSYSLLPMVQKAYLKARWDRTCIAALKPFIRKCLLISWYMVVQTPPLVFLPSEKIAGEDFDSDLYKVYTKAGPLLDYVVWPALCLHEGGPLLCKGIVQGRT